MASLLREPIRSVSFRPLIWLFHMALPIVGLWLLLGVDLAWQDNVGHFWLVLVTALIGLVLAVLVGIGAHRHEDASLYLVALGFSTAAGFLAIHSLVTPTVVVPEASAAFNLTTPVGVAVAGLFAFVASLEMAPERAAAVLAWRGRLAVLVGIAMVAWAMASLVPGTILAHAHPADVTRTAIVVAAVVGIALYAVAAIRYLGRFRQRSSVVLLSIVTADVLLAESLVAMALAGNWHASWWLWHVLMAVAFGYIAYAAHVQYRREGAAATLFTAVAMEETLRRLREGYADALDALVQAIETAGDTGGEAAMRAALDRLAIDPGISDGQAQVLEQAADALAGERLEGRRLAALVEIGREARVVVDESTLLGAAETRLRDAFPDTTITILRIGEPGTDLTADGGAALDEADLALATRAAAADQPVRDPEGEALRMAVPLRGSERTLAVLVAARVGRPLGERAEGVLESAANQLAVALENVRLYRQVERLFRSYLSPDVVRALLAEPSLASLGGEATEATVLFADLRGYTSFSAVTDPAEVVGLLNRYFGAIVPLILAEGGTVAQFVGDAIFAIFNAPVRQADHPLRAARVALAMQRRIKEMAADRPDLPRFRVGIETGPVVVGNIGATEVRTFTAIGATTNLAARLQAYAEVGSIVVGPGAAERLRELAELRPLGGIDLKGYDKPIMAFELVGLRRELGSAPPAPDGPAHPRSD